MKNRLRAERGMSLVEATIILMVLAILTAVVAPSVGDYVEDARATKAKEDVEAIGMALARLLRDSGLPCVSAAPTNAAPCNLANRVDLLVSASGTVPTVTSAAFSPASGTINTTGNLTGNSSTNWYGSTTSAGTGPGPSDENVQVQAADRDTFDAHLATNTAGYSAVSFTGGGGPRAGLGWRGAYLTGPLGADPWGFVYQANTVFLATATDAANDGTSEGQRRGGWLRDVVVLSSGGNGIVQTAFGGTTNAGSTSGGDDVVYVFQGATR